MDAVRHEFSWASVLVVDDDPNNREILSRRLQRLGCRVLLASDGIEALDMLRTWDVDLVLLDIMMPGLSGFDVLEHRRGDARLLDVPFIVISALDDIQDVVRGIELGAEDYLPKPFDPVLLRARIGACLEKKWLRDQDKSHVYTIESQAAALADWNRTLESRVAEQIEALRESEERLRQAQKMEAIGLLAGGIAHDFNNLLTATIGFSELLAARMPGESPLLPYVHEITNAGRRAATLTQQLLAFSRKQVLHAEVLDLNVVVHEVATLLRRVIGDDVELIIATASDLGPVKVDRGQLEQVILNLAVNARDAMPNGGMLKIQTANIVRNQGDGAKSRTMVLLTVTDSGLGIDANTRAHIFEPFFTTKEPGKGTGLGLATVHGIVHQSGGEIEVESTPGEGASFRIYLPVVNEPLEKVTPAAPSPGVVRGAETVLLVEDQPSVRALARVALETSGFTVLEAASAEQALELCDDHLDLIDLVLTDIVMPGMNGRELVERIQHMRPGMKVLYVSGYTDDEVMRHGLPSSTATFLQKPFTPSILTRKVREVLDGNLADGNLADGSLAD